RRPRHRARRERAGRAALGQQGQGRAGRTVQRPLHRGVLAPAQRRQRAVDRRARGGGGPGRRDPARVAHHRLRGRPPPAPHRRDHPARERRDPVTTDFEALRASDPAIADIIDRETERQNTTIQLIASENFTSPAVLAAQGSVLTNKYSEGYPAKRYYGGNFVVDEAEELARQRLCELFGTDHANVQPHSGANANMATYLALLDPGDKVMGMRLDQGGHLTHGSPVNASGRLYDFVAYG